MDEDEVTRVRQGASATTSPDILLALATDPSVTVRASLALNPKLPAQISVILAADTDPRVRNMLARKLVTPAENGRQSIRQAAVASLSGIIADAGLRVRMNLAQSIKDLSDGPSDIVLRLAHDRAVLVCEPVIHSSPMLTQDDLLTLIATGPPPSTVQAVAARPMINTSVSDAVVGTGYSMAISALLANSSAQIREATLDLLAARSADQTDWQAPLVLRPNLSQHAQRLLFEIVTGNLLNTLAARGDIDPSLACIFNADRKMPTVEYAGPPTGEYPQSASEGIEGLNRLGRLGDKAIMDAVRREAISEVIAMIAAKAHVPIAVIERARTTGSPKAIIALAWRAGLTAQTAVVLQSALAHLPPDLVLSSGCQQEFPLSEDEMRWQLASLDVPDHGRRSSSIGRKSVLDRQ